MAAEDETRACVLVVVSVVEEEEENDGRACLQLLSLREAGAGFVFGREWTTVEEEEEDSVAAVAAAAAITQQVEEEEEAEQDDKGDEEDAEGTVLAFVDQDKPAADETVPGEADAPQAELRDRYALGALKRVRYKLDGKSVAA